MPNDTNDADRSDDLLGDGGLASSPAESVIVPRTPDDRPDRPDAATYLLDAVDAQNSETLRAVARYALELAAWQERDLEPEEVEEEVVDADEELVDVSEAPGSRGTVVLKKIPCGDETCGKCPHGPYKYLNYREDGEHKTEYLGKP